MTLPASSNYDFIELNAQATGTYGPFVLPGGNYGCTAVLGSSATVDLQILGPDGSTKVDVVAQFKTSNSYAQVYLPPGSYYVVIGTAASSFSVQRIRL